MMGKPNPAAPVHRSRAGQGTDRGWRAALAVIAFLMLSGCGSTELIVLLPSEEGKTGQLTVTDAKGNNAVVLDHPLAAAEVGASGRAVARSLSTRTLRDAYGPFPQAMPKAPSSYVLYFEFGSLDLTPESQSTLQAAILDLRERPGAEVEVIGHTDRVGAPEDNDRLSLDRAGVVQAMLLANAVDGSLVSVSGRGEREPLIRTPDEVRNARNRRVEVLVR